MESNKTDKEACIKTIEQCHNISDFRGMVQHDLSSWNCPHCQKPALKYKTTVKLTWLPFSCRHFRLAWHCCSSRLRDSFSCSYFSFRSNSSACVSSYWEKTGKQALWRKKEKHQHTFTGKVCTYFYRARAMFWSMLVISSKMTIAHIDICYLSVFSLIVISYAFANTHVFWVSACMCTYLTCVF